MPPASALLHKNFINVDEQRVTVHLKKDGAVSGHKRQAHQKVIQVRVIPLLRIEEPGTVDF